MGNAGSITLNWALLVAMGVALFMGCARRNDAISRGEKKDIAQGVHVPSIAETKAIAEEGFVYGLPLVMNHAIMTAYSLDPKSPGFMAPLNQILNEPRLYTPKNWAIPLPNSDTPYFFGYLDFALQFGPALPEETDIRAKLAKIGIGAGKTFDFKDLSVEHKAAILLGMKDGEDKIDAAIRNFGSDMSGWNIAAIFGDRSFYNGAWLKRAAAAKLGIRRYRIS